MSLNFVKDALSIKIIFVELQGNNRLSVCNGECFAVGPSLAICFVLCRLGFSKKKLLIVSSSY